MVQNIKTQHMSLKGVILDWAGTTIDYGSRTPTIALKDVLDTMTGTVIPEGVIRKYMGYQKIDHVRKVLEYMSIPFTQEYLHSVMKAVDKKIRTVAADNTILIDGVIEFQEFLKQQNILLGTNTGYTKSMMEGIAKKAMEQGYSPEYTLASDMVSQGRPYPWGCFTIAEKLGIFPMSSIVKIGDNIVDIEEGLNAGTWSVGVVCSSNMIGLSRQELSVAQDREALIDTVKGQLLDAGAHLVISTIAKAPKAITKIQEHIKQYGLTPKRISTKLL